MVFFINFFVVLSFLLVMMVLIKCFLLILLMICLLYFFNYVSYVLEMLILLKMIMMDFKLFLNDFYNVIFFFGFGILLNSWEVGGVFKMVL